MIGSLIYTLLLLLVVETKETQRVFKFDDMRASSYDRIPPPEHAYFNFSVSDVVVGFPQTLRIYFDSQVYDPKSLQVTSGLVSYGKYGGEEIPSAQIENVECKVKEQTLDYVDLIDCPQGKPRGTFGVFKYRITANVMKLNSIPKFDPKSFTFQTDFSVISRQKVPWPLENVWGVWPPNKPNAIGNLFEDYQTFGGIQVPYWHHGLDIRSELDPATKYAGKCRSPVAGKVVNVVNYGFGILYWSVMVMDDYGFIWQFHHLDPKTFQVKIGDLIKAGQVLGSIAKWPASHKGHLYHHVHMNVVRPNSAWKSGDSWDIPNPYIDGWLYYNPLDFLDNGNIYTQDMKPYSDGEMFLFQHGDEEAFSVLSQDSEVVKISGNIDIVLNFNSEFTKPNNVPGYPYILGVKKLEWSIINAQNQTLKRMTLFDMDRIGLDATPCSPEYTVGCMNGFLLAIYRQSFKYNGKKYLSLFDYRNRHIYYSITNSGPVGYAFSEKERSDLNGWNTLETIPGSKTRRFPNGLYQVKVQAFDWFGNEGSIERFVMVEN